MREMEPHANRPLIVDIKRYSFEDGPGIRSVVFFKGCPLRCVFCHNPEAQDPAPEIAFSRSECVGCGSCAKTCDRNALDMSAPDRILRDRCDRCGKCCDVCPGKGLRRVGIYYPVCSLAEVLLRDSPYYKASGGGITLSGGECTMFPDYLEGLLRLLKTEGLHVALETCGYFHYPTFRKKILPYVDLIYYDIKLMDRQAHKRYMGKSNGRILRNFSSLVREGRCVVQPRVPLVPGITATEENILAIVGFLKAVGADRVSLLPYNPTGLDKYRSLGRPVPEVPSGFMSPHDELAIYDLLGRSMGSK